MDSHNLILSSVVFLLDCRTVKLPCISPLRKTAPECRKSVSEGWLQRLLQFWSAFYRYFCLPFICSLLFLFPLLNIFLYFLTDSFLYFFVVFLFTFKGFDRYGLVSGHFLDKIELFLLENFLVLLVNLLILR